MCADGRGGKVGGRGQRLSVAVSYLWNIKNYEKGRFLTSSISSKFLNVKNAFI